MAYKIFQVSLIGEFRKFYMSHNIKTTKMLKHLQILASSQVNNKPKHRENKNNSHRTSSKLLARALDSCDDEPTPQNTFSKIFYDSWFGFQEEDELPVLSPNQMYDRLMQLTKRQKPFEDGMLSITRGTVVGKVQFNGRCFSVILYSDSEHGRRHWSASVLGREERGVYVLL